ncbi:hypothetical protein [Flavobacterium sp.]|uniref:hypothetical protein n=1 Tax=Flavobacterium sp. TaxID=239 RepID=UPI0025EA1EBF|nr:hypothetical protein [Flavobacterium sp.]
MKNIHVLPTENESRICYNSFNKVYELCEFPKYHTDIKSAHNIYITSDEEIEDGDWVYFISTNEVIKVPLGGFKGKVCKKIILTTDQYLIKDGVQAIDDEFLEWLVKNPSCEWVYVNESPITNDPMGYKSFYKIIIPKEEPKQETLEEVAEKWVFETNNHKWSNNDDTAGDNYNSFKEGAKWQINNQDNFAIEFAEWLRINYYNNGEIWIEWNSDDNTHSSKELLEIFKNTLLR